MRAGVGGLPAPSDTRRPLINRFEPAMDKDIERAFLDTIRKALVSLPFDLKVLLEAVADSDLEHAVRELAAATVVHVITPKDGNVEAPLRFAEDVVQVRLALAKIAAEGGEGAPAFRDASPRTTRRFDEELSCSGRRWATTSSTGWTAAGPSLLKAVYSKKKIPMFVDDEEVGTFLYDEGLRFGTLYPITEKSLAGRVKQAQPFVDHLARKRDQDKRKITS